MRPSVSVWERKVDKFNDGLSDSWILKSLKVCGLDPREEDFDPFLMGSVLMILSTFWKPQVL